MTTNTLQKLIFEKCGHYVVLAFSYSIHEKCQFLHVLVLECHPQGVY